MEKKSRSALIVPLIAGMLVAVLVLNIVQVFRLTSNLTCSTGRYHLESISGELEATIRDAELLAMRLGLNAQPYLDNRERLESFIYTHKQEILEQVDGCFNVYMAGTGWAIIPDFDMPEDYIATERDWYKGAKRYKTYVSAPYVDAMTGNICFTVAVMLSDWDTVLALDYTMDVIQSHITQMYENSSKYALIVTSDGIIAGCSDESLIGRHLTYVLPEYASVFSLVKSRQSFVTARVKTGLLYENLFAASSGFGWYLIVSENDWDLYRDAYLQLIASMVIALLLTAIIMIFFLVSVRQQRAAQEQLRERERLLSQVADRLIGPLNTLLECDRGTETPAGGPGSELVLLHTAGRQILEAIQNLGESRRAAGDGDRRRGGNEQRLRMNTRFRARILLLICFVVLISAVTNIRATMRWGGEKIRSEVNSYDYTLTEWVSQQKSILDMFCSVISTNPELLADYEGTVEYLDRITRQYPEISVTYMSNPAFEPNVYMNNGWKPPAGWHVEERQWYIDTLNAESGWTISDPYYDEQTGLYCVTFAERVYDSETGAFLGNFGIDFFLDKLIDILGGSYSDSGYAFLADTNGVILNHPYGSYQMTEEHTTNVSEVKYGQVRADGVSSITVRDYDGTLRIVTAKRNSQSRFTVYEAASFFRIYGPTLLSNLLILAVLLGCAVMVYRLLTALMLWQDEMNAKMREAADSAIAAGKAKSRFLAQMSHEIRTPINAVLGMNEMILRETNDKAILDYASSIQIAGRTLLSLINSILDFSKIEEGKMEIVSVEYDTTSVIHNLVMSIAERARSKGLALDVDIDPGLPARLIGDDVRLSQVITNLLTNAVKYTEKGSVRFSVRGGERRDGAISLLVRVEDTGIGIRQEDMPRLFESFERLDEVRNHSIEGTGLGMSIVTRLLSMMGSRLEVESVYGRGSVFSFSIRQRIADETPIGDYAARLENSRLDVGGETLRAEGARVLVVDDNEMNLKVAKNLLKLFGIVPELAGSGFEAVELIRRTRYDLVLLDHMMPKMDGVETLRLLREEQLLPADTRVIVLTANAVNGAREQYLAAGFDDYLSKPIDVRRLEELLRRWLPPALCTSAASAAPAPEAAPEGDALAGLAAAGFDTGAALRYAGGDRDFCLELAADFAGSAARNAEAIRLDFERQDWADYQIRVHALKSSARQIGANALSELALRQELAARDRKLAELEAGALLEQYAQTAQLLRNALGLDAPESAAAPQGAAQDGAALLPTLREARDCMENFEAERALEKLRPLAGSGDAAFGTALDAILEALDGFDTFTAEQELDALIARLTQEGERSDE